jgi:hypothetical protein
MVAMNLQLTQDPLQIASLAIALLASQAYDTLLPYCSPPLKERHMLLNNIPALKLYQWNADPELEIWLQNIDFSSRKCYYRVFDQETTHCRVVFRVFGQSGQLAVVLLYMNNHKWAYHDIKLLLDDQALADWSTTQQLAKQEFSLLKTTDCNMSIDDDESSYWNLYNREENENQKRPLEEVDESVDYWDRY